MPSCFEPGRNHINSPGNIRQDGLNGKGRLLVFIIHDTHHGQRIEFVNPAGSRITGFSRKFF